MTTGKRTLWVGIQINDQLSILTSVCVYVYAIHRKSSGQQVPRGWQDDSRGLDSASVVTQWFYAACSTSSGQRVDGRVITHCRTWTTF
jgi:hypothetical protein